MEKIEYRGISINPFDNWVYGSLLTIYDDITEKTLYYIRTGNSNIEVTPDSICRKVYEWNGIKYFDKDIIEYDYEGVRRIEPIIDNSLMVYIGRQCNNYAHKILGYDSLNIKVIGNIMENVALLDKQWESILTVNYE